MKQIILLTAALFASALGSAPTAFADPGAACQFEFEVGFGADGAIEPVRPGTGLCAGTIGGSTVDPAAFPARIAGSAGRAAAGCLPELGSGRITGSPGRFIAIDGPQSVEFEAAWAALVPGPATGVSGTALAAGFAHALLGEADFTPDSADCPADGQLPRGTIRVGFALGRGVPSAESSPAEPAPAPAQDRASSRKRGSRKHRNARRACKHRRGARKSAKPRGCLRARGKRRR